VVVDGQPVHPRAREKYGLKMDMSSIPVLAERYGLAVAVPPSE
jgi:hypothetical protein